MMKGAYVFMIVATASLLVASGIVSCFQANPGLSSQAGIPRISSIITGKILTIALEQNVMAMDPVKTWSLAGPAGLVYETLISRDTTGAYRPGLAEWWNMNVSDPDHPVFELRLKQGVKFHDGLAFDTAALKRIMMYYARNDSWMAYQFYAVYGALNKTGWPDMGVWCKDAYNVSWNLTWADQNLVFNLSMLYAAMMSPDALESDTITYYGKPGHKVVGTGPFMLQEWVDGDHVTLVKNANYSWGAPWYVNKGPAMIDKVIFRIIPDDAMRRAAFEAGYIDVLDSVEPSWIQAFETIPSMSLMTAPGQGTYHFDFNCQQSPWDNPELRKGFAFAVNRTQLVDLVWHGYAQEGVNYLSPIVDESRRVPAQYNFTYDGSEALTHFAAAGYSDTDSDGWLENSSTGNELTLNLWTTNQGEEVVMSEILQLQFAAVGVHVSLSQFSEDELRDRVISMQHQAAMLRYSWPRADILDWQFGSWAQGGSNTAWYGDPVFDQYVVNWTYAQTPADWSDNATAGHIRLLSQCPRVPLVYWHQIEAVQNYVTGWYIHPWGAELEMDILDVDIDRPPSASISCSPPIAIAGDTVTLDGSQSSDDLGIVNWTWTFDDGTTPVELWGETVEYTVQGGPQDILVTLTVRDTTGNTGSATTQLAVVAAVPEWPTLALPVVGTLSVLFMMRKRTRS